MHAGGDGRSLAVEALGPSLAQRLSGLATQGCDVMISVCQDLSDDGRSTGLYLTPAAVAWTAAAGAAVSIDQFVTETAG